MANMTHDQIPMFESALDTERVWLNDDLPDEQQWVGSWREYGYTRWIFIPYECPECEVRFTEEQAWKYLKAFIGNDDREDEIVRSYLECGLRP